MDSNNLECQKQVSERVGYASMPPTRCQPNSMPGQLDAKPTFNSLTFKLLFTNPYPNPNPNPNPNQLPGIESAASSWAISLGNHFKFKDFVLVVVVRKIYS